MSATRAQHSPPPGNGECNAPNHPLSSSCLSDLWAAETGTRSFVFQRTQRNARTVKEMAEGDGGALANDRDRRRRWSGCRIERSARLRRLPAELLCGVQGESVNAGARPLEKYPQTRALQLRIRQDKFDERR